MTSAFEGGKVLVTGGAGFIGSHLVKELVKQGASVRVLDDFSTGQRENLAGDIEVIEGSVTDAQAVASAVQDIDIIFHEAAQTSVPQSISNAQFTNDTNVRGTLHVLMAARKADVKKVIFASSAAIYGDIGNQLCNEAMQPLPLSPYAASKSSGEIFCSMYHHLYGLDTVCLRYFNVFGPGQRLSNYAGVITAFINCFRSGSSLTIFGDGQQSRDFVHVRDVVQANLLAAEKNVTGQCINIASGKSTTITELLSLFQEITGKTIEPTMQPSRTGDIQYSLADISKAKQVLDFSPTLSVKERLVEMLKTLQ